ncbi:MAG: NAD(P)H-dependent oxidoreductase [Planctomycetota bacterium]
MRIAVICCSLNPESRSAAMAESLRQPLEQAGVEADWIDLRDHPLPICDGSTAYAMPEVQAIGERVKAADGIILALPIYNYDGNAAAKNLIELTGKPAWLNKTVSFVCSAGGRGSFMSIMPMANSLMLDFRCVIVPRFVYADDSDFPHGAMSPIIEQRISELAEETVRMTAALSQSNAAT